MDQEDTKLAGPLYRFICFSESNGNAMRLIWMLTNALSRLLNPLNCSPTRPHNAVTLCSLSTETSPEPQFAFRAIWAPESCIQQLLAGWAKNLHQLGSFRHHHKDLLPQHCCQCKRDPLLQHCCQRKRLTQCSSELPPR